MVNKGGCLKGRKEETPNGGCKIGKKTKAVKAKVVKAKAVRAKADKPKAVKKAVGNKGGCKTGRVGETPNGGCKIGKSNASKVVKAKVVKPKVVKAKVVKAKAVMKATIPWKDRFGSKEESTPVKKVRKPRSDKGKPRAAKANKGGCKTGRVGETPNGGCKVGKGKSGVKKATVDDMSAGVAKKPKRKYTKKPKVEDAVNRGDSGWGTGSQRKFLGRGGGDRSIEEHKGFNQSKGIKKMVIKHKDGSKTKVVLDMGVPAHSPLRIVSKEKIPAPIVSKQLKDMVIKKRKIKFKIKKKPKPIGTPILSNGGSTYV